MNKLRIFLVALLGFAASSALSQDVRFNFDETADFAKFKTYKWVTMKGAAQVEGLTDVEIKAAFDAEMAKKGLAKVDTDTADLFVGYQFAVHSDQKFSSSAEDMEYSVGLPWEAQCPKNPQLFTRENLRSICMTPRSAQGSGEAWPPKPSTSTQNPTAVRSIS